MRRVFVIDRNTLEVLHNGNAKRIRPQKNGATRSIVRMRRRTSFVFIWSKQYQSRDPYEDGHEEGRDNCNFHDNLLG